MNYKNLGQAFYHNGQEAKTHPVTLFYDSEKLYLLDENEAYLARWLLKDIRSIKGTKKNSIKLTNAAKDSIERLIIQDQEIAASLINLCKHLKDTKNKNRFERIKIILMIIGLLLALTVFLFKAVPFLSKFIVPYIPAVFEETLAEIAEPEILKALETERSVHFCSQTKQGFQALYKASSEMARAAGINQNLKLKVIDHPLENAFVLPAGRILIGRGLIEKAHNENELLAVIAHELSHIKHQDSLQKMLELSSSALLIGFFIGDVTGGTLLLGLGQKILNSHYSQEAEKKADLFAANLLQHYSISTDNLINILKRISMKDAHTTSLSWFSSHPSLANRIESLHKHQNSLSYQQKKKWDAKKTLLTQEQWAEIKNMCQ